MCRGFCPAWAGWGKAPSRPAGPRRLRGRGADGLCLGLFVEVLVLLVRSEEGLLLECRISRTGRLLQPLLLFKHPELLAVLGLRHGPLFCLVGGPASIHLFPPNLPGGREW